ncbi:MAG: glycosyltransferase [Vallitalea sp.]|jgi:GT2 family glycosyltransferase/glycosyltransferase involved in cell wall biosynthesis|nr:glycosyltransferase [Vallitalea sp.]
MKTSIIILTYNNLEYTKKCIDSIRKYTNKNSYELIVVDNHSQDGTVQWLENQENIKVIFNNENLDFPKGCNQGIKIAKGDNILLLNNDVVVTHNWLDNMIKCLYSSLIIGAVGPLTNYSSNFQSIDVDYNNDLEKMHMFAKRFNISNSSNWEERLRLIGFCMLIKKEVVNEIGLLDELFTPSSHEDDDYSLRIRNAGYRLYLCKDTFIHHYGSVTSRRNPSIFNRNLEINKKKFYDKWNIDIDDIIELRKDITSLIKDIVEENPKIMHIGCKAGGTLLDIKNQFPKAELHGIENEANHIGNIDHIAKIHLGGLEKLYKYDKYYFDYVIVSLDYTNIDEYLEILVKIKNYIKQSGTLIVSLCDELDVKSIDFYKKVKNKLRDFPYSIYRSNYHYLLEFKHNDVKEIDEKKISFITLVNNDEKYEKCLSYIKKLEMPEGFEVECISITNVNSIASGYNKALNSTNAKYKVYLHQDVYIKNKRFLKDIIKIFTNDTNVGMIGVAGCKKLPSNGIWWEAENKYGKVIDSHTGKLQLLEFEKVNTDFKEVEAIDGFIMATQFDLPWKQDVFDGWHFYDISQCEEFRKSNYKIVVPKQEEPWCIHDCGIVNTTDYEKYRLRFIDKYKSHDKSDNESYNENKICFISCIQDERMGRKALEHIKNLKVPEGFKIQCIFMRDVKSVTKAYNFGIKNTNAKYKVYLRDNLFIINNEFIYDILKIFNNCKSVGMIGITGSTVTPTDGVLMKSNELQGKIIDTHTGIKQLHEYSKVNNYVERVEAISDSIMITQYDVTWREDIFDSWFLYNMSQCMEFINAGYEIVIPKQNEPWCFHACGIMEKNHEYEKYRQKFIKEYSSNMGRHKIKHRKHRKKTFVTLLLPGIKNVHLIKDVGMIPYIMYKYYGYDSSIVVGKGEEFPYTKKEVKGLKLNYIDTTNNPDVDGYNYLLKNAMNIDILQLYHLNSRTLNWVRIYKSINPKGKVYIKIDGDFNYKTIDFYNAFDKESIDIINECDLISIETKDLYNHINNNWPIKVEYIPNGFYTDNYNKKNIINYDDKENIICTVGRLGTYQKATDVLIEAFALAADKIDNWKLKLIGPVEPAFEKYINEFLCRRPHLENRIIVTGNITNRVKLDEEYKIAKIFCLPSRWESFGIVLAEAISKGCYPIISNIEPANDITDNKKYGDIFEVNNVHSLALSIIKACNDEEYIKKVCNEVQSYAYDKFNWVNICGKINRLLEK